LIRALFLAASSQSKPLANGVNFGAGSVYT
jgi:hypothetical protein